MKTFTIQSNKFLYIIQAAAFKPLQKIVGEPAPGSRCEAIIFPELNEILLLTPKVASRSIIDAINSCQGILLENTDMSALQASFPQHSYSITSRNPWDRIASCYLDKVVRLDTRFRRLKRLARHEGLKPNMPFPQFVEWLCGPNGTDEKSDRHWASQTSFLTYDLKFVPPLHIIKLESLEQDFFNYMDNIAKEPPPRLDVKNESASATKDKEKTSDEFQYKKMYTKELFKLVERRYSSDIENFDYHSENNLYFNLI